jgi:hypothetical protein
MVSSNSGTDFSLDTVQAKVHYTTTDTTFTTEYDSSLGPCDWAMQQATAAKALEIELYIIGWGLDPSEQCNDFAEDPTSPYYNWTASQLLQAMATDADHFYNEPKTEDLEPIFNAIGSQLTGGSRLVE